MQQLKKSIPYRHIHSHDLTNFLRQLATLLSAGIPITQCCEIIEASQHKTALRLLVFSIKREILTGKNLFHSLKQHTNYFDEMTRQLIKIGEYTGQLDTILKQIVAHQEKYFALQKRIKQALFYPFIIIATATVVILIMLFFIVPKFNELFQDSKSRLPLVTIIIFSLSDQLRKFFWFIVILCLIVGFLLWQTKKLTVCMAVQRWFHKTPIIKTYMHKIILTRFARNFALAFTAGIPIIDALKLAAHTASYDEFVDMMLQITNKISAGLALHMAMNQFSFFPPFMIQMVKIGEESGTLAEMHHKIADLYEADIEHFISFAMQLLEPLIMLVLGVVIGGIVIGMYLPIFNLGSGF